MTDERRIGRTAESDAARLGARLYTTSEAAEHFGIDPDLISLWKARRRVTPAGLIAGRGRGGQAPLYKLEHLQPLVDAYRARHAETPESRTP